MLGRMMCSEVRGPLEAAWGPGAGMWSLGVGPGPYIAMISVQDGRVLRRLSNRILTVFPCGLYRHTLLCLPHRGAAREVEEGIARRAAGGAPGPALWV